MKEFHWEQPIPEKHHNYNFDVRKVRLDCECGGSWGGMRVCLPNMVCPRWPTTPTAAPSTRICTPISTPLP